MFIKGKIMKAAKLRRSAKIFCYEVASGKRDFAGS
jgi:hypothetical protein